MLLARFCCLHWRWRDVSTSTQRPPASTAARDPLLAAEAVELALERVNRVQLGEKAAALNPA
jgi:hypothetical protein